MDLKAFSGKKIGVAISGGADSVALLHYLKTRENEYGYSIVAVHCEHGIRGEESVGDMLFVEEFCRRLAVKTILFKGDCLALAKAEKRSLETVAREFRRECFSRLIDEKSVDYIATAHHQNDEAETVLFRIARGTSLTGAVGMKEVDGWLIRPFLDWSKEKILAYVSAHGLAYRTDSTNENTDFTRNRLRADVLPVLENAIGGASENIARFAKKAADDDELLYEYAKQLLTCSQTDGDVAYTVAFCDKKPLFYRACLLAVKGLGLEKDYTTAHLDGVYALQNLERGSKCDLPKGIFAQKTGDGIAIRVKRVDSVCEKGKEKPFALDGFDGGRYQVLISTEPLIEENGWRILRLDRDKIPQSAIFRFRKEGDVIQRFGGGRKSLKKFFNEEKTPVEEREYLPLIAEPNGEVYAVCGVEISGKVKVDDGTKTQLYIKICKK